MDNQRNYALFILVVVIVVSWIGENRRSISFLAKAIFINKLHAVAFIR